MPLSEAQKKLHWNGRHGQPGWYHVAAMNRWQMVKGRLREDAERGGASEWHGGVWRCAEALAAREHRAVSAEDLRKGSYVYAMGYLKSSKDFNNSELDRVLIVFTLLCEPERLASVTDWRRYLEFDQAKAEIQRCRELRVACCVELPDDPGERRRQLYFIRQTPEAIVRKVAGDRFGEPDPAELTLAQLRQLTTTLKNRRAYEDRPAGNADRQGNGDGLGNGEVEPWREPVMDPKMEMPF